MPGPVFSPEMLRAAIMNIAPEEQEAPAAPPKHSHTLMHAVGLPVFAGGQAADAISTLQALKRPGTAEGNPLYGDHPSAGRVLATKAAVGAPIAFILDKLADTHPKLALALSLAGGGAGMALAAHNSRMGKK